MGLNSAQKSSRGLGALPTEQLGCVPQMVELGIPGVLSGYNREHLSANHSGARVGKDATFLAR